MKHPTQVTKLVIFILDENVDINNCYIDLYF
jgi:hypothetical protein